MSLKIKYLAVYAVLIALNSAVGNYGTVLGLAILGCYIAGA